MPKNKNQYLERRGDLWYYFRRVPKGVWHLYPRRRIRKALRTKNVDEARLRRDLLNKELETEWGKLAFYGKSAKQHQSAEDDYQLARARCGMLGHNYKPLTDLIEDQDLPDMLARLDSIREFANDESYVQAVFGLVAAPEHGFRDALRLYVETIAPHEITSKSKEQRRKWIEERERSIEAFETVCGPLSLGEITRHHAVSFHQHWRDQIIPDNSSYQPNTANKKIGHLRKIYRLYWTYYGQEDRPNPFRNLRFQSRYEPTTPVFTDDWVRTKILAKGALDGLIKEAQLVVPILIETGCRLSEIVNLQPEHIRLDHEVPHIKIRPTQNRELKTPSSKRDIPLIGVALKAMKQAPGGFPKYADNATALSNLLGAAFRRRGLFPTPEHRIYSFRHSFEKRMLEAGLDYGLRCTLMGHKNDRPQYGDGGSLEFRRNELLKLIHPMPLQ